MTDEIGPPTWVWKVFVGCMVTVTIAIIAMGGIFGLTVTRQGERTNCVARELAGPWVGLKATFEAPPGDVAAREKAGKRISMALDRLDHVDEICG